MHPPAPPATTAGEPIITASGLTKTYKGVPAVRGIDLEIRRGEIFGILGPNGAGKTTTLEMIEGLRVPDGGSITVAGLDAIARSDEVRQRIGVQLQSTALFPFLSAGELIELFANFYGVPDPDKQADRLLPLVGLEEKRGARAIEMSGGQQQRLSIALALVNTPEVTFLDEPTTGLDPRARRIMWDTILGVREAGTTVVLTTHYMEEAEVLCDRIAIMDAGRIIACDTPEGLIRALPIDATVSATIDRGAPAAIAEADLAGIPGVAQATIDRSAVPPTITAQTGDVQATLVGLLELAAQRGVTLGELTSTRASLEDVFLTLTGRSYTGDDAEQAQGEDEEAEEAPRKRRFGRRSG
jgi:ABC-2 type transport system ATP-binding protein